MKCSKCGKEIANDSLFCEYCGTEIKKDNANKESNTKRVDIRWALLPAMLMATFMVMCIWGIGTCEMFIVQNAYLGVILSIIIFLITIWYSIKRRVPISFVLIMGLFLISNCGMFYDLNSRNGYMDIYTVVSWNENATAKDITLSMKVPTDNHGCYLGEEWYNAEKFLNSCQQLLAQKLKQDGAVGVNADSSYISASPYITTSGRSWLETYNPICFALLLFYIIYAFIAHKRAWRF